MRFFISLYSVILCLGVAHSQTPNTLLQHYDSLDVLTAIATKTSSFDSTLTHINAKIDSLQLKANTIINPQFSTQTVFQRLRERRTAPTDTLTGRFELDSIKGGFQHKIDSLSNLNLPTDKYKRKLDSISQFTPQSYFDEVNVKVQEWQSKASKPGEDLESKINKPVSDLESKVNEKLALMNEEGGPAANLPGSASIKDVNMHGPELKNNLNLNTDLNVPGLEIMKNQPGEISNPLSDEIEQLDALKDKISGVKDIPQKQIDQLESIDEVKAIQGKAGEANVLIDKAQAYQQDVSRIANGDLSQVEEIPKAIESRISNMEEMQELQKQTAEMTKYQDMLADGNDPEAVKALAKETAVKYATDHFAGKEAVLQSAMDKMSKLKSKYSQVSSLKDLPKRVSNPMKRKPFIERVVPGLTFQIQKAKTFMLDLNPTVSWRFTGRFSAGAGWNERLSFDKWNAVVSKDRIYGARGFACFSFRKGFSLKAEFEKMNTFLPNFVGTTEGGRAWVWSVFGGFKKDYTFFNKVNGNVQVLYNLYDDHDNSPYLDKLNVRMGWEISLKRKK